jgi:hypothetical protein
VTKVQDLCKQAEDGNVIGVMERLLVGWDVNAKDETGDVFGGVRQCAYIASLGVTEMCL